jgi:U4/U6 small nuclear ribonucleoprotein PRP3
VKISNLMRVLGESAVADPSAIEKQVRQQMAQRQTNHDMRNLARMLTPEERKEKRRRKLMEDTSKEVQVAVFRVTNVDHPQHRFKIDVNAQENFMTGVCVLCKTGNCHLVAVEGGPKAIRKFVQLMTHRIDWNAVPNGEENEDGEEENSDEEAAAKSTNTCECVWQGTVAKRSFSGFTFEECRTPATARALMDSRGVPQYWDMVNNREQVASLF